MEIHKPHAARNLREFLVEIGTIVVGILIALGLEQMVESWHEHEKLEETIVAIDAEIREGLASTRIVADMQECQQRQLALLSDAVGKGDLAQVRTMLAQGEIYSIVPFNDTAWTSALASDVSNHLDQRQRNAYSGLYYVTAEEKRWTADYFRAAARLASLAQSGLSQSPAASTGAVAEVAEMTSILTNMQRAAKAYQRFAEQGLGMKPRQSDIDARLRRGNIVARCKAAAAALDPAPKF